MSATPESECVRNAPLATLDIAAVRRDFPILEERVNGHPLACFDK